MRSLDFQGFFFVLVEEIANGSEIATAGKHRLAMTGGEDFLVARVQRREGQNCYGLKNLLNKNLLSI